MKTKAVKKSVQPGKAQKVQIAEAVVEQSEPVQESTNKKEPDRIVEIEIGKIFPSMLNPRKYFEEEKIVELAQSINEHGILQYITVREVEKDGLTMYEIILGERRYRAAKLIGLMTMPCVIRQLDDDKVLDLMITENLQRENMRATEEGHAYKFYIDKGHSISYLSERFGKSEPYIYGRLSLVNLIPEIDELANKEALSVGAAIEISRYEQNIQSDIYLSHLDTEAGYCNWKILPLKVLKEKLETKYTTLLNRFPFDKTECNGCSFNSELKSLFPDLANSRCQNSTCLLKKQEQYTIDFVVHALKSEHMEVVSNSGGSAGSDALSAFKELGIELKCGDVLPIPEHPIQPILEDFGDDQAGYEKALEKYRVDSQNLDAYNLSISERMAVKVICLDHLEPVFGYMMLPQQNPSDNNSDIKAEPGSASSNSPVNTGEKGKEKIKPAENLLASLQEKDKKNKLQAISSVVDKSKTLMKEYDLKPVPFTEFEENLLSFVMIDHLTSKHLAFFGFNGKQSLTDEEKFQVYKSLNEEQKIIIKRNFLIKYMLQTSGLCKKSALFIELVRLYCPEDLAAIEYDIQEDYQKKQANIQSQIKKIEVKEIDNVVEAKEVA